jgi:flagellar biogenesis protein FliO
LSPKQSVCLIRVGRQLVLAGLTPDRINSLMIIDDPERVSELLTNPKNSRGSGLGRPSDGCFPANPPDTRTCGKMKRRMSFR